MLYNEAPAVYNILMLLCPHSQRRFPHPQTVALVCTASDDPALRKPKFRRYMKRYEREGCYCRRGKLLMPACGVHCWIATSWIIGRKSYACRAWKK